MGADVTDERHVVIVDVETSGLLPDHDVAVEVAWWDLATGERGCFVPVHDVAWVLEHGNPQALEINGYRRRLATAKQDEGYLLQRQLKGTLRGNTIAGSNPGFDVDFLRKLIPSTPWHHRKLDLATYAAAVLGIPPWQLPGLSSVCERLSILNSAPHTAEGDVDATGHCFLALFELAGVSAAAEGRQQ
jgi:DNA polymerase-3 subunit epsilon